MSIATDMALEWLDAERHPGDQAERLGAGTAIVRQLLAEVADLQAQLDAALDREQRREAR